VIDGRLPWSGAGVHVIAATNCLHRIEPCLRTVGRLERALAIGYPDWGARRHIAAKLLGNGLGDFVDAAVTAEVVADLTAPDGSLVMVRSPSSAARLSASAQGCVCWR
jgi:SpoVK/Ycf46/Vps4 family AAA+-type ATPase